MDFSWDQIPEEHECLAFLEYKRWNSIVVSPFNASSKVYRCGNSRYKCQRTGKYFNVKTNTIFHNTKIPLRTWFAAIFIAQRQNITSVDLAKLIGITQKSAWYILRRLKRYEIASASRPSSVTVPPEKDRLPITDWLNLMRK